MLKRLCIVVVFGIAFGYIEAAGVVYLRAIFYPDGFSFPLIDFGVGPLWGRLLLTEIGREAATLVLIFTGAFLFGRNRWQRVAYFMVIFAVWDIFYYVWLKVLIGWPVSVMDWDILFLMPVAWASPVLAPVIVSLTMLIFALVIFYRDATGGVIKATLAGWAGFCVSAVIVVVSFCVAGLHGGQADYASYFYWPLFVSGEALAIAVFSGCLVKSR